MGRSSGLDRGLVVRKALEVLEGTEPSGLTLASLAKALGVQTPSLYHHVGGLDDLRCALRLAGLEALERALQGATVGRSGRDALEALARAYLAFARERPALYPLTLAAGGDEPDSVRDAASAAAAAERLVGVVLAVLRGYGLDGDEALHATRALRSSLHGFVTLEAAGAFGLPLDLDATFARVVAMHDAALSAAGKARS